MKKFIKRVLSVFIAAAMIVTVMPFAGLQMKASAAGGVAHKLQEVVNLFPDGSNFTVSGNCCAKGHGSMCSNCYYPNVVSQRLGWDWTNMYSSYSCYGFTCFVTRYIFGTEWPRNSTVIGTANLSNSTACNNLFSQGKIGDVVSIGSSHRVIFLAKATDGMIVYDSNQGDKNGLCNMVRYYKTNTISGLKAYYGNVDIELRRMNNYDEIDGIAPEPVIIKRPKPDRTDPPSLIQRFSYNGRIYEAYASTLTWEQSKTWCENNGGHLATITQACDQVAVNTLVNKYDELYLFLGAENTSGTWKWVTGEPFSYTYWGSGQPDGAGGSEKYLGTYKNGTWNDFTNAGSDAIWGFILEKDVTDVKNTVSDNLPGVSYTGYTKTGYCYSNFSDGDTLGEPGNDMLSKLSFSLKNCEGGITYSLHLSSIGWTDYVSDGAFPSVSGQTTAIESIKVKLTGDAANKYNIYYRSYVNGKGWYGWTSNDNISGTMGAGLHISAIQVMLVPKVKYSVHVAEVGWTSEVADGEVAGTTGQAKRCEAFYAKLADNSFGDIEYSAHSSEIGWGSNENVRNGRWAGTTGLTLQMEGFKINLTGEAAKRFDVAYNAHCEDYNWTGWVYNGSISGTTGKNKRLEALEIKVIPKGAKIEERANEIFADGELGLKALIFNTNGGNYSYSTILPIAGSEYILPSSVPEKSGFVFAGWYKNSDFSGTRYMPEDVIKMDADYTLHAKWETSHVHTYTSEVTKAASCTETGIRKYTCDCGDSYTVEIPKTEHHYISSVTTEPSCVEEGVMTYICSECGDSYTESIPEIGEHTYVLTETHNPTCTEAGKYVYECSICGDIYIYDYAEPLYHSSATWHTTINPTATSDGLAEKKCDYCGEVLDSFVIPCLVPDYVTGITLSSDNEVVGKGDTVTLTATVNPDSAKNKNVVWSSMNTKVATVNNGVVTALRPGAAAIVAQTEDGGYKDVCFVRVISLTGINGAVVDNENGLIYGLSAHLDSVDEYINLVDEDMSATLSTSSVGTGTTINVVDNGEIIDSFDAVIFGDVNGDGWYDGTDAMTVKMLANGMLTEENVSEAVYMAADCNHDGVIGNFDVEILEQAGLLLADVDQTKSEEELLETSAYVEYLNLISQTVVEETTEVIEDEPVNPVANPLSKIISVIKDLVAIIKAAVAFIKADMPGLPFSFKK